MIPGPNRCSCTLLMSEEDLIQYELARVMESWGAAMTARQYAIASFQVWLLGIVISPDRHLNPRQRVFRYVDAACWADGLNASLGVSCHRVSNSGDSTSLSSSYMPSTMLTSISVEAGGERLQEMSFIPSLLSPIEVGRLSILTVCFWSRL